jgi:hypothetical protein
MTHKTGAFTLGCAAVLAWASEANAGRHCEEARLDAAVVQRALDFALETRTRLEQTNAEVVFIGRAGQDLSRWGLRYSHLGLAWRDHPKGRWMVVHQLNLCGTARSEVFDEGLGNFFLDDLWKMEAVVLVPGEATQRALVGALTARDHLALHQPHYSMVAYPYSTRYQNSNQWALEVLANALVQERDARGSAPGREPGRERAQAYLRGAGFEATELKLDTLTRLGARLSRANVAFDDHPGQLRWNGRIHTVTVDAVLRFIQQREQDASRFEIR